MPNDVILFGSGQLGSRYLQGLVDSNCVLNITVVDPSLESLEVAKLRWLEVGGNESKHNICWEQKLPDNLSDIDLAIITTTAKGRARLVKNIADMTKVRYWVLEKVLAQSSQELNTIETAINDSKGVWVNTARRMMQWHQSLKKLFFDKGPINVKYIAANWGLACNSIHFIDLVAWWSGQMLVSVDTRNLDRLWHNSKRMGYFEITGELVAYYSDGSTLRLVSKDDSIFQKIVVKKHNGDVWEIDESLGEAKGPNGQQLNDQMELQSQISGRLVDDILIHGECCLPTFEESSHMHSIFLKSMLDHWNRSYNRNDHLVPIT